MTTRRRPRGQGSVLAPTANTPTYAIRYVAQGRRRYRGGFLTEPEAKAALAEVLRREREDRLAATEPMRMTVAELGERWLPTRGPEDATRWARDVEPYLGAQKVGALRKSHLTQMVASLKARGLTGATIERALYLLSAACRWRAAMYELPAAASNPVSTFLAGLPRKDREALHTQHDSRRTPFLEHATDARRVYAALVAAEEPDVAVAYALGAMAGLRPGEAQAQDWADVNLQRRQITVRQSARHGKVGQTKSRRERIVPVPPGLVDILAAAAQRRKPACPWVVASGRGLQKMGNHRVTAAVAAALKTCGLPALSVYQATRHSYASRWVLAGKDVYQLSGILGHSSVETTQRYAHLKDEVPAEVLAAVDF